MQIPDRIQVSDALAVIFSGTDEYDREFIDIALSFHPSALENFPARGFFENDRTSDLS